MKKQIRQRVLSLALVLVMVLGMVPMNMSTPAKAEEAAPASSELSGRIETLAMPVVSYTEKVDLSTVAQKDLAGSYVLVSTTAEGTLYALEPQISNGKMSAVKIAIENGRIVAPTRDMLTYLIKGEPDCSYYLLRNYDRKTIDIRTKATPAGSAYPYTTESFYSTSQNSFYGLSIYPVNEHQRLRIARWLDVTGDGLGDMTLLCCDEEGASFRYLTENHGIRYMDAYRAEPLARDLYDLLQAASAFADSSAGFDATAYSTFTAAVESSISLYNTYNRELSTEEISTAREKLDEEHLKLRNAMFALGNGPKAAALLCWVNTLTMPSGAAKFGNQRVDLTGVTENTTLDFLDRNYFFVAEADGKHYVFDRNSNTGSNDVPITVNALFRNMAEANLHISGTQGHQQYSSLTLWHISGKNGFRMGMSRDNFFGYINGSIVKTKSQYIVNLLPYDQKTVAISIPNTNTVVGLSADNTTFEIHEDSGTSKDRFYLYRFLWSVEELYRDITSTMRSYLNTPENYDQTDYHGFLDTMERCLQLYERYNVSTVDLTSDDARRSENIHEVLRDQRNNLVGYKTLLNNTLEYIDIPVTMMDFRSDGLLMQTKYQLFLYPDANVKDPEGNSVSLPGSLLYPNVTSVGNVRMGLTEANLTPDGKVRYNKDLVTYVAASLYSHCVMDLTWNEPYKPVPDAKNHINKVFATIAGTDAAKEGTGKKTSNGQEVTITYGSYEETEKKAKDSGGMFTWDQVTTWFDMAYYVTTYLWQPVPETEAEKLPDGFLYNQVVPEITTMRMYKNDSGEYIFTSDGDGVFGGGVGRLSYSSPYMYNSVPSSGATEHPKFAPLDGLGFESDPYNETDVGSSRGYGYRNCYIFGSNFNFSMHAHGGFVYYKDQDLYFRFRGDDDVMFFINGRMACDIGAAHGVMPGELKLNDKAEELGLKDGEFYNFDMFYAERNATGSNITFTTNIQIVSRDGKTSKVQYAHTNDGEDLVNQTTGLGQPIEDHQTVNVGEVVAYGFGILNDKDTTLINASFRDDSLGVNISPDNLTLCDKDNDFRKNNGIETTINNIRVYYRSHTDGTVTTQAPVERTYDELTGLLDQSTPFTGSYFVRIENDTQLKTLLARGIPVGCQMMVYGFLRRTVVEDLNYTNTVHSLCYYVPQGENTVYPIIGEAQCHLRVPENSSLPQVRKLEVVLDYGKAVSVPLIEIPDLIHFEDGSFARVGDLVGFLADSPMNDVYHGMLLKERPAGLQSAPEVTSFNGKQGTFTMETTALSYQPTQFLTQTERVYAVVELHDFYCSENGIGAYSYVVAEITFTPAHVMYYETDFAPESNIFTLTQAGSFTDSYGRKEDVYPNWTPIDDKTGSADPYQDYQRLNGTVYHTDIDPEYIPAEAFFVDFDGEGYERRYRDNPQYKGYDFDKSYWATQANGSSSAFTIDKATGTMTVQVSSEPDSWGNYGPYVATTTTPKTYPGTGMSTLALSPSQEHYIQIRFKVENCTFIDGEVPWVHFLYWYTDPATGTTKYDEDVGGMDFKTRTMGEYQTLTIPIPANSKFSNADDIRGLAFRFRNIKAAKNGACVTIDYIYIGPEMGMEDDIYGNYLFVGFDNTPEVPLRYSSSIYGTDSRFNTAYRPLDTADAWASSSAKDSIRIQKGLEGDANNGYIYFEDKLDDSKLDAKATKNYSYIHAGSIATGNGIYNYPINYTPTLNDFCQIRIKIENGGIVPEQVLGLGIEYSKGNICGKANLDTSHLDGNFHTITFPLDAPYWKKHWVENKAKLNWLHPVVYNLQAKSGATTGAKITIDYIFIGPEHMLDRVSQHAKPGAEKVNHLFFDFNNNDAAKVRYTYPIYGSTATNYDLRENWSVDTKVGDTEIVKMESGAIVFKDKDSTITWNYIHSAAKYWEIPLAFVPGKNDYLRIRMKIDKGTAGTAPNGTMTVALENFEGDNFFSYGARDYSFADYADGVYHIFTVPLDKEDYLKEDVLTAVRPVISGTQNCTFTVDYIYVGPLTEGNPSAPSLYFGFGDRGSGHWNTDRLRYDSDTYGFLNYDTNRWLSESEAVTSSLTQNIYGWKTAGNENRGNPVDAAIKDYVPPFPPTENVSYPNVAVAPKPDTGNLEVVVEAAAGTTADTVAIQTYPSISSPRYYWRHFMQTLNYHPAEENIVQVRFRTEGLTIKDNFAVKLMYLPTGASAFCTSDPLKLAPQMPLNPEEDYVIMTAQLDDTFDNAPAIERLRLVFEGVAAEKGDKILIDYVYAGVGRLAPEPVYGYDSSYLNDTKLSNGSSYVVTGRGVKTQNSTDKYTEASFSFRGTGFDIISRTDMNQGTIRVEVWKKGADKAKDKAEKILTVNNKGELELFQIPVVSVQGLKYGDYDVTLWVNAPVKSAYEFLNHKGNFHFDAVRIYDPMGEDTGLASEILYTYLVDTEGYASVKEVRNILLSAEDFASQLTSQSGAIFVDSAEEPTVTVPATDASGDPIPSSTATIVPEGITVNNHITASATTYDKIGPKNEVYLAPGQAVAFMLKISTTYVPTSVDVAVKTIKANEPANLVAGIVKKEDATATKLLQVAGRRDITVGSATELYYALPIDANTFYMAPDGNRYCYIVLYNNGSTGTITNVLSVTDIKVAYDEQPEVGLPRDAVTDTEIQKRSTGHEESYYDFVVDGHTLHAAALVMKAALETPLLAEGTKLMHSLNLASDISVNYAVLKDSMADYTDFYLQVRIPGRAEALRIDPVEKGIHYYFTLDGLTAVQMTDVLEATLYMEKAGRIYRSETDYYSIAQYAYTQLRKDTVSTELKTLCAELLRYGSKAQIFKSYGLDRLADGDMTAQDRAYLSDIDAVTFGNTNRVLGDLPNASIVWAGKSLSLESKVALKFVFHPADDIGDLSALTLRMSYTDTQGMTKTVIVSNPELYNESLGYYVFTVDTLLAAELRAVVSVQIYAGDTPVSATLEYSPDTYGNNKTGALLDLCRALFAYCDSAKAFFA